MRRASGATPCISGQRSSSGEVPRILRQRRASGDVAPHPWMGGAFGDIALHPGTAACIWRCLADPQMAPWIWRSRSACTDGTRIWKSRRGLRDTRRCPWMYGDVWRPGKIAREREEGERDRHAPPELGEWEGKATWIRQAGRRWGSAWWNQGSSAAPPGSPCGSGRGTAARRTL